MRYILSTVLKTEHVKEIIYPCGLTILLGFFIGTTILEFDLIYIIAVALAVFILGLSIWKIEIPFIMSILLLVLLGETSSTQNSIFAYIKDINLPGIPSFIEMSITLLIVSYFLRIFLKLSDNYISLFNIKLIIFLSVLGVSLIIAIQNGASNDGIKRDFKNFIFPVLFFLCSVNILNKWTWKKIRSLLIFVLILIFTKNILGILNYLSGYGFLYGEGKLVFKESADHMMLVAVIIVLMSVIIYNRLRGNMMLLYTIATLPMIFSIIFSYRRTAWLGFLVSLVFLFLTFPKKNIFRMILVVSIGFGLLIQIIILFNTLKTFPSQEFLLNRFKSIIDTKESSIVAHFIEWKVAIEDTSKQPLLGLGLGGTHSVVNEIKGLHTDIVHNAFIMLWMKMGLVPVILLLWCIGKYIKFGLKAAKEINDKYLKSIQIGLFASVGFWIVSLNVGPTWFYKRETCLMALAISIVLNLSVVSKKTKDIQPKRILSYEQD
jgi:hypothetical protein